MVIRGSNGGWRLMMECAVTRGGEMRNRKQLRDRNVGVLRVSVLRAVNESLTHHFDQPRQVWRRVNSKPGERTRRQHPEDLQHHTARRRPRHRIDVVVAVKEMDWLAPGGPIVGEIHCR